MFVHGAICVSVSGQCLMSAMLGGRSGNRGQCAQPCRMCYDREYPLSIKDMCLAYHIPSLIEDGVASLKIEGRMKNPSYVYGVTKIYRKLLDQRRAANEDEIKELQRLFSRSGFTDGYYTGNVDGRMLGVRTDKDISDSRQVSSFKTNKNTSENAAEPLRALPETPSRIDFPIRRNAAKPIYTASFRNAEQIPDSHDIEITYLPLDGIKKRLEGAVKQGAKHLMIHNIGQLDLANEFGLIPHGSHRLNVFNNYSADLLVKEAKLSSLVLSAELILPQIRDIVLPKGVRKGAIVYGRLPLMLLHKPVGKKSLRDSKGVTFPIFCEQGKDVLYNSVNIYMADQLSRLDEAGIEERHLIFSTENKGDVMRAMYAYNHGLPPKEREAIKRIK